MSSIGFSSIGELPIGYLPPTSGGSVWNVAQANSVAGAQSSEVTLAASGSSANSVAASELNLALADYLASTSSSAALDAPSSGALFLLVDNTNAVSTGESQATALAAVGLGVESAGASSLQDFVAGVNHSVDRVENSAISSLVVALLDAFVSRVETNSSADTSSASWQAFADTAASVLASAVSASSAASEVSSSEQAAALSAALSMYLASVSRLEQSGAVASALFALTRFASITEQFLDPYAANVVLLMHMDGANGGTSFSDATGRHTTTPTGATTSTAVSVFGGASALFNGSSYIAVTGNIPDFIPGTGNYTLEFWMYVASLPASYNYVLGKYNATGGSGVLTLNLGSTGNLVFNGWNATAGAYTSMSTSAGAITAGAFHHVAIVVNGENSKIFVDGLVAGSANLAGVNYNAINDTTSYFAIGRAGEYPLGIFFSGYIDEIRLTKGVARYVDAFTPPGIPFSLVSLVDSIQSAARSRAADNSSSTLGASSQNYTWSTLASELEAVGSLVSQTNTTAQSGQTNEPQAALVSQISTYDAQVSQVDSVSGQDTQTRVLWITVTRTEASAGADLSDSVSSATFNESRVEVSGATDQQSVIGALNVAALITGALGSVASALADYLATALASAGADTAQVGNYVTTADGSISTTAGSSQNAGRGLPADSQTAFTGSHTQSSTWSTQATALTSGATGTEQSALASLLVRGVERVVVLDASSVSAIRLANIGELVAAAMLTNSTRVLPVEQASTTYGQDASDSTRAVNRFLEELAQASEQAIAEYIRGYAGLVTLGDKQYHAVYVSDRYGDTVTDGEISYTMVLFDAAPTVTLADRAKTATLH